MREPRELEMGDTSPEFIPVCFHPVFVVWYNEYDESMVLRNEPCYGITGKLDDLMIKWEATWHLAEGREHRPRRNLSN